MKQPALIIIKPDGISKRLVGNVFEKFAQTKLDIIATKIIKPTRALARQHYKNIKGQPFFEGTCSYFCGNYHKEKNLVAVIYYGENSIKKCRKAAGTTNPKDAAPGSIRGTYGRISSTGIFENVVHVSSDKEEAKREIKLWFSPDEIIVKIFPTKTKVVRNYRKRVWL